MKQLMLAAVAATLVFASAAQAAEQAAPMTPEQCKAAMEACTTDACKDELVAKHGCVKPS